MKLQTGRRSAEKSDLTQAGLSEGACCMPLFTMPSKEGHAGPFEVPDHPCRQPQNLPPLNFYAIGQKLLNIYSPIDVYFLFFFSRERDSKKHFYASHSSGEKDHKQFLALSACLFYCDVLI